MTRFKTILADPPWMERGGGKIKRGADKHYPLMSTRDICSLRVDGLIKDRIESRIVMEIAEPHAHLYLWVTNNFLSDGLDVMQAWGFRYVTCITWVKDRIGLGQYFRGQTEQLLFGVRGQPGYKLVGGKRQQGTTLIQAPRGQHSAKPEEAYRLIEKVSSGPFIELFARSKRPGWTSWGNEV